MNKHKSIKAMKAELFNDVILNKHTNEMFDEMFTTSNIEERNLKYIIKDILEIDDIIDNYYTKPEINRFKQTLSQLKFEKQMLLDEKNRIEELLKEKNTKDPMNILYFKEPKIVNDEIARQEKEVTRCLNKLKKIKERKEKESEEIISDECEKESVDESESDEHENKCTQDISVKEYSNEHLWNKFEELCVEKQIKNNKTIVKKFIELIDNN